MTRVAFGLGSNLGDRAAHLRTGLRYLVTLGDLVAVSSIYETAPIGGPPQGAYLNAVVVVDTPRPVDDMLEVCRAAEAAAGREPGERFGPRTLDVDVLLAGDLVVERAGLLVPHPRMTERRFVIEPLLEAWPDAAMPDGTQVALLAESVADQDVRRVDRFRADAAGFGVPPALVFLVTGIAAVLIWLGLDRLL